MPVFSVCKTGINSAEIKKRAFVLWLLQPVQRLVHLISIIFGISRYIIRETEIPGIAFAIFFNGDVLVHIIRHVRVIRDALWVVLIHFFRYGGEQVLYGVVLVLWQHDSKLRFFCGVVVACLFYLAISKQ